MENHSTQKYSSRKIHLKKNAAVEKIQLCDDTQLPKEILGRCKFGKKLLFLNFALKSNVR
jgi:hypothetical protein